MNSIGWLKSIVIGMGLGTAVMAIGGGLSSNVDWQPKRTTVPDSVSPLQAVKRLPTVIEQNIPAAGSDVLALRSNGLMNDPSIRLVDGFGYADEGTFDGDMTRQDEHLANLGPAIQGPANFPAMTSDKMMRGVDQFTPHPVRREPSWRNGNLVSWEQFGYGEYVGPFRTPHMDEYRIRIGDQIELNFIQIRPKTQQKYQLNIGDLIQISSPNEATLNQPATSSGPINGLQIMPDGTVSLALIGEIRAGGKTVADLQRELNDKYLKYVKNPSIVIQVTKSDTPVMDLLEAVDSRFGQGGRSRQVTISPDGTLQLPLIGSVPAIGLSLNELHREINARYRERLQGIEITPILSQRAPRFVYVVGEVRNAGRFEMTGPTSAMQAVALAGGFNRQAGNLRQIIVFRRDQNWQLVATKLDLGAAFYGKSPRPSDEIWLRDSDIILIPPKPIQRFSDAVNLYMTSTIYAIFPQQGVNFNFDSFRSL